MLQKLYQNQRARLFVMYVAALLGVNFLLFKEIFPTGLWFWSAFITFLLSGLLSQPYFTSPRDSLANAIAVMGTVASVLSINTSDDLQLYLWRTGMFVALMVLMISLLAMFFKDSESHQERIYARMASYIARLFGSPRVLFSALFFLTLYTFHGESAAEVFWLSLTWVVVVVGHPLEHLYKLYCRIREIRQELQLDANVVGHVEFRREPGLVTMKIAGERVPNLDSLVVIPTDETHGQLGLTLDNFRLSDRKWSSILVFADRVPKADIDCAWELPNTVLGCDETQIENHNWIQSYTWTNRNHLVGVVIEQSDIHRVKIELCKDNVDLFEGQMVRIRINDTEVLYQIVNGITKSELLEESNRHGFMSIEARKLGHWNDDKQRFDAVPWTPNVYAPVFAVVTQESSSFHKDHIGYVPRTDYGISVNCHKLVTHNTAILGVLGSGKTSLALELIRRMVEDGIKIWVIDITGQYQIALGQLIHLDKQKAADTKIRKAIDDTRYTPNKDKDSGGNHIQFATALNEHINSFMKNDDTWRLRVFDPGDYSVTEQTSFFNRANDDAGFSELTATQITRIVAEELLNSVQDENSEEARLCLVLEEAHSLVPEWNSAVHSGDQKAANGTAKAVLQGRKYGFGCLLVTQRTANVTKSILNQCNTIFGLKVFDATGMDFLSNYIGAEYAGVLATLPNRQCVAFGSALNTQLPLIVELNDRDEFEINFQITNQAYLASDNDDDFRDDPLGFASLPSPFDDISS